MLEKDEIRPLVLMSPKSMLRNQVMASTPEEFSNERFETFIETKTLGQKPKAVERIVFATGKLAVELRDKVASQEDNEWIQIISIEQLYPLPFQRIQEALKKYPNVKEFIWAQEEPKNMGAWSFIEPRLNAIVPNGHSVSYVGRKRRSSPSEGDAIAHKLEQNRIITTAITRNLEGEK
jgi:2-oxoglutarate dehydrogenase E1 component